MMTRSPSEASWGAFLSNNDKAEYNMLTRSPSGLSTASTVMLDDSPWAVAKFAYEETQTTRLRARLLELEEESEYQRSQNAQKSAHIDRKSLRLG